MRFAEIRRSFGIFYHCQYGFAEMFSASTLAPAQGGIFNPTSKKPEPGWTLPFIYHALKDRIDVGKELGRGYFGSVVAVTIKTQLSGHELIAAAKFFTDYSPKGIKSIDNEISALRTLHGCEGIIQLKDVTLAIDGVVVGVAMELGSGTLKDHMPTDPIGIQHVVRNLLEGGKSLAYKGVVHRDLKPANITKVNRSDGYFEWKIVDFGLAVNEGDPNTDAGTVLYRSPESYLLEGSAPASSKQDVFAMGLIIAELLLRKLPDKQAPPRTFIHGGEGGNPFGLMNKVSTQYEGLFYNPGIALLRTLPLEYQRLVNLVEVMIHPDPDQRPGFGAHLSQSI